MLTHPAEISCEQQRGKGYGRAQRRPEKNAYAVTCVFYGLCERDRKAVSILFLSHNPSHDYR